MDPRILETVTRDPCLTITIELRACKEDFSAEDFGKLLLRATSDGGLDGYETGDGGEFQLLFDYLWEEFGLYADKTTIRPFLRLDIQKLKKAYGRALEANQ